MCVCDKVVCEKVVCERVVCEDGRRTRRVDGWIGGRGCTKQRCGEQWQAAATMLRCICLAVSFSDFHWNQQKRFSNPLQPTSFFNHPLEPQGLKLQRFSSNELHTSGLPCWNAAPSWGQWDPSQETRHHANHTVDAIKLEMHIGWQGSPPSWAFSKHWELLTSNCDQVTWQLHIFVQSFGITYIHYYTFSGTSSQWESSWRQTFREALILRQYNSSSQINCTIPTVSRL